MNYQEWQQNLKAAKGMLSLIPVAGEQHVNLMGQVFYLLGQMEDECAACIRQAASEAAEQNKE